MQPKLDVVPGTTRAEVDRMAAAAPRPVLQVGSRTAKVDNSPRSWRALLGGPDFFGMDLFPGDNVDLVADICADFAVIDEAVGGRRFGFVICQHLLEHVKQPWKAALNLTRLLAPGGQIYVAVPWVQAFHPYPNDFWRFSFPGLMELFPGIEFFDMYWSATGSGIDAAYKVLIDGKVDLARTPFEIEGQLFQIETDRQWNLNQPAFTRMGKAPLARTYLPIIFVNALGRLKS